MNMIELNSTIERHRPLEALSSLPVAYIDNAGEIQVFWFNYYLNEINKELTILIESIFVTDKNMQLKEINVNIRQKAKILKFNEPELSRQEYLSSLALELNCYNYNEMKKLLEGTEIQPLLIAYKIVRDYLLKNYIE